MAKSLPGKWNHSFEDWQTTWEECEETGGGIARFSPEEAEYYNKDFILT